MGQEREAPGRGRSCKGPDPMSAVNVLGLSLVLRTTSGREAGPGARPGDGLWLEAGHGGGGGGASDWLWVTSWPRAGCPST